MFRALPLALLVASAFAATPTAPNPAQVPAPAQAPAQGGAPAKPPAQVPAPAKTPGAGPAPAPKPAPANAPGAAPTPSPIPQPPSSGTKSGDIPDYDQTQYVNTLIGSAGGGNVFAGATLPYGMAKCVPDSNSPGAQGGWVSDGSNITGISCFHDSGVGSTVSLANFQLFPFNGAAGDDVNDYVFSKKYRVKKYLPDSVKASPGYFSLALENGVTIETTTTDHVGLIKFKFGQSTEPKNSPLLLLDLTDGSNSRQDNATVKVDPKSGRITGGGRFVPSFGVGTYQAFFCIDFQGGEIRDTGIVVDSRASSEVQELTINRGINGFPLLGAGFVRFKKADTITARVGLSFLTSEKACQNAEREIEDLNAFDKIKDAANKTWADKLAPITVSRAGVDPSLLTNFYSGVYRTFVQPQNYTGENPLWQSAEPYWDSFYCIWDTFRSQFPFLILTDPAAVASQIRGLIDIYRHEGWLPDCRMSFSKGLTQGGSNADVVLADAYVKNVTGEINWQDGYAAIVKDATVEPYFWSVEGRGHIDSWNSLHYVPVSDFDYKGFGTMTRSISLTLEYSYNDYAISEVAGRMGKKADQAKFQASSRNWQNLFKADQASNLPGSNAPTGFTGFFQPKHQNKTWGFQDPLKCSNIDQSGSACSLTNNGPETYESSIWEYQFYAPHQMATLITLLGGPDNFVKRLDYMHDQNITYIGNEPAFLTVFQYHYAGRPGLSAKRAHFYIPKFFGTANNGLPGNDDSGAMGSFVAFTMIGLFPVPGQAVYLITAPFFDAVQIKSPQTGKVAKIKTINFDAAYKNIYIEKATLDGVPYTKNWLDHSFFTEGKELVLTLTSSETTWGAAKGDLPPSLEDDNTPKVDNNFKLF